MALTRYADVPADERRRMMQPVIRARAEKRAARKLAESIRLIHAAGGMPRAIARVKAAGVELEAVS